MTPVHSSRFYANDLHLFPANLGDSACITEMVQAISAVRQVRRPVGHDSAAAMSNLVALLPSYMQIVQNWSEKGVETTVDFLELKCLLMQSSLWPRN